MSPKKKKRVGILMTDEERALLDKLMIIQSRSISGVFRFLLIQEARRVGILQDEATQLAHTPETTPQTT